MYNQRFSSVACSTNMHPKAFALPLHISDSALSQAVIVQPCFTNTHYFLQICTSYQIIESGFLHILVVGMYAYGTPEIIVGSCKLMNRFKLFKSGTDT